MGCGASTFGADGISSPARLRPFFLPRVEDLTFRRRSRVPLKDSSNHNSKKVLLSEDTEEEDTASKSQPLFSADRKSTSLLEECQKNQESSVEEGRWTRKGGNGKGVAKEDQDKSEGDLTDGEFEDVEDEVYDQRMLKDDGFPGSPSFRVYVTDHGEEDSNHGATESFEVAVSSKESTISRNESHVSNKIVKRGRKMKSFKRVLPRGGQTAVKNLLNVTSCYHSSSGTNHRTHLLPLKTVA